MRHALLAPCAVFLAVFASAQSVEVQTPSGNNTGVPTPVTGSATGAPTTNLGGANASGDRKSVV